MAQKRTFFKRHKQILNDIGLGVLVFGLATTGVGFLWISTLEIPDLSTFEERRILQSTKIYDRTGEVLLYDLHQDVKRTIIPLENISRHIKNATVAIEDDSFYTHWGVRPLAIVRAAITNIRGGDLLGGQGGSTITQQVIKNSILVQEKTLTRKIKEAILAIRLEQVLTKEQILAHYLNESPYGGTIYGVEEASQSFYGKSAADVTLAEAAYLAALPQAPTRYSPYGNARDTLLENRKNFVLQRMLESGFITQEEHDAALEEEVAFLSQATTGIRAPHFVMYIREQLADEFGEESLSERGFRVITTLDYELQDQAEQIVYENAMRNKETFDAENASMVALDPRNGEILVMVGSRDYFDEDIDGNYNATLALRQPGSSFKPFVYAAAFEKGYTPQTTLFDVQTQFSTTCSLSNMTSNDGCYAPSNYDDRFRGPVSMKNALAQSLNIPSVKTLYLAGVNTSIKLARDAGITTLTDPQRYGLTLVLGGGEVRLLEMAEGYGMFANEGVRNETNSILRIEDRDGNTIKEYEADGERVLDRDIALQISDILSDNVARTPLYGANSQLHFGGRDVAVKTGTTNNYLDAWILGYTPNLVVGVWAGNNTPRPMNQISGLIVTPMWREFMDVAIADRDNESFGEPASIPSSIKPALRSGGIVVDSASLAQSLFSSTSTEQINIVQAVYDNTHSILHYVNKDDPRGPYPSNPSADGQYRYWEYGVSAWKNARFNALFGSQNNNEQEDEDEDESNDGQEDEDEN
ncbi:MAG: PBP1A family penicillin-binding protein [Candidatus Paceibacterota bacterium]